jgi:predicted nucleic acid-binding protein
MAGDFVDTNILVYAFTDDPRCTRAQELLGRGCIISVQVLNEFTNVARRKLRMDWTEVREALDSVRIICPTVVPMDVEIHEDAVAIAERHRLSIYDALIAASALYADCATLWSEDMQDGMVVDGRLQVRNPFRAH